jgi:hypothetical protein
MSLKKENAHKRLTVQATRGVINNRYEKNTVRDLEGGYYDQYGSQVSYHQRLHLVGYLCHLGNVNDR